MATASASISIGIAASMTAEPLGLPLRAALERRGFSPAIAFAPVNQIHQTCRDPEAAFGGMPSAILLLWRAEDICPALAANPAALDAALDDLSSSIAVLRARFGGTLILTLPPIPEAPGFHPADPASEYEGRGVFRAAVAAFAERVRARGDVRLLDLAAFGPGFDPRTWFLYRQPWTPAFWRAVADLAARTFAAPLRAPKKCLVLDADNTLWGGIIGEDGVGGIALGGDFPGSAYRAFQSYALHLKERGVLLAVASKNNPGDVEKVFDAHDAMLLKRTDIAAFEVNWNPKPDSLRAIAEKLNIGLDSLVFVDDSPREIEEVRARLPEVVCLQVPEDAADLPALLASSDLFDFAAQTAEDRARTGMIAAEDTRKVAAAGMDEESFQKSLGLAMSVFRASDAHLDRAAQLVSKTNQFNLTTRRRSAGEIAALMKSPAHAVICMTLKDKYGDYGLVGVAVLEKQGDVCEIDTLLVSCRALGRGAEEAFLSALAAAARADGCALLRGTYLPTPKNAIAADFYARLGFSAGADGFWSLAVNAAPAPPTHIALALEESP